MQEVINIFFGIKFFPFLLIATIIFSGNFEKRKYFLLRLILLGLVSSVATYFVWEWVKVFVAGHSNAFWRPFFLFGINFLFYAEIFGIVCFCYRIRVFEMLLCEILGWCIEHIANCLSIIIACLFNFSGIFYRDYSIEYFVTTLIVYFLLYAIVYVLEIRYMKHATIDVERKSLIIPCLVFVVFMWYLSQAILFYNMEYTEVIHIKLYGICCAVLTVCVAIGIYDKADYRKQLAVVSQLEEKNRKQYQIAKETIDSINEKCHDLRKMISSTLLGNVRLTEEEICQLKDSLNIYDSIVDTGNKTLNVVLSEKSLYCQKNNIRLSVLADGESLGFLSEFEIYSLFANVLDNAIEAVMQIEPEKRVIALSVRRCAEKNVVIHEENYFSGVLNINADDHSIKTSKEDKKQHGFGILSIKNTVKKYDGFVNISTEGNTFSLDIMIPVQS